MSSDTPSEITLQQINKCYSLLDNCFHILDISNDINTDHHKYIQMHLEEVIRLLEWSESYLKTRG